MKVVRPWAGLAGFCRSDWPLLLLVFVVYTNIPEVLRSKFGIAKAMTIWMLFVFGVIAVRMWHDRRWPPGWVKPLLPLGAYGLACVLSLSQASDVSRAGRELTHFVKGAAVAIAVILLLRRMSTLRRVVWTLLSAGIVLGSVSVVQHVSGTFDYDYFGFGPVSVEHIVGNVDSHRIRGVVDEPNYYAMILLFLAPLALERLWSARMLLSWLASAWSLAVCALGMVLTYSRGALVGAAAALVLLALLAWRIPPRRVNLAVTILVPLLMLPLLPSKYFDRMMTLRFFLPASGPVSPAKSSPDSPRTAPAPVSFRSAIASEPSFRGRLSEVIVAWQMFRDNPFLGVGCGNYEIHYQEYARPLGLDPRTTEREPHSLYLEVAAETGLVGVLTFGALLWILFAGLRRSRRMALERRLFDDARMIGAFEIAQTAYLVASLFLMSIWTYHFWLAVGIAFAIPRAAGVGVSEAESRAEGRVAMI